MWFAAPVRIVVVLLVRLVVHAMQHTQDQMRVYGQTMHALIVTQSTVVVHLTSLLLHRNYPRRHRHHLFYRY